MSDRAKEFDLLLEEFLQQTKAGQSGARHQRGMPSEVAPEDLQLLQVAIEIRRNLAPTPPAADFVKNSEIRLKNRMKAHLAQNMRSPEPQQARAMPVWRRLLRPIPVIASLVLVLALALGSIGVVGASAASLPGDVLYPVKRGLERARLAIAQNDDGDAALLAAFAQERIEEIEALTAMDRLEGVEQAVASYLELTGQLSQLAEGTESAEQLEAELANNVQVLQRVLEQVPPSAQPAILHAIEQSQKAKDPDSEGQPEQPGVGQGNGKPSEPPGQGRGETDELDQRTAEQVANQYQVPVDEVEAQFTGECESDWQCVREHFRVQKQNQRFAEQIARQYGTTAEAVMQVYQGSCEFEWPCVRAHFRGSPPGGGKPDKLPAQANPHGG